MGDGMKRLVDTEEGGLTSMLGKGITVFCGVYIYTGTVSGVNDTSIELQDAKLVYDTGAFDTPAWADAQELPSPWRVQVASIESWGSLKC